MCDGGEYTEDDDQDFLSIAGGENGMVDKVRVRKVQGRRQKRRTAHSVKRKSSLVQCTK